MKMSPRSQGGIGPTSSPMKVNYKSGAVGFSTYDPAHGTPSTSAPSYYQRKERWKQNLSEEDFKALLWCILPQHFDEMPKYSVDPNLAHKLGCPNEMAAAELRWLQNQAGYEFIARQVKSKYLEDQFTNTN